LSSARSRAVLVADIGGLSRCIFHDASTGAGGLASDPPPGAPLLAPPPGPPLLARHRRYGCMCASALVTGQSDSFMVPFNGLSISRIR